MTAQSPLTTSSPSEFSSTQIEAALMNFLESLSSQHCSNATIRNYRSDIRQFYKHEELDDLKDIFNKSALKRFVLSQKQKGLKDSSVTRKMASITQFALWSKQQGLIAHDVSWMNELSIESLLQSGPISIANPPAPHKQPQPNLATGHIPVPASDEIKKSQGFLKLFGKKKTQTISNIPAVKEEKTNNNSIISQFSPKQKPKKKNFSQTASNFILPYLNLGLIFLFFIGLGFLGYNQLVTETPTSLAYPSAPVSASRVLSFQGRLTDTAQNPITTATNMEFKIWDQLSGGTEGSCDGVNDCQYETSTCSVTPDQDGIFNVGIGDDCGSEINQEVFSENAALWLEVTVGGETLTPRQPIRTVPFAINSETVQGYPISASESATVNTILVMDAGGYVTLGEDSPTLTSDTGTFTISGSNLSLEATNDIFFTDARVTDLPLSVVDTEIEAALGQGIVDAINDLYALNTGSSFFSQTDNLIYPTEYWNDEFAIGGNSSASASILLSTDGTGLFTGTVTAPRFEDQANSNYYLDPAATGYSLLTAGSIGIKTTTPNADLEIKSDALNSDVLLLTSSDGSRLGRFTETGGGHGWFEVDNASGVATALFRADGGANYLNAGNFGIGDTTPTSLFTVGNGDLFQVDSTGSIVAIDGVAHSLLDTSGDLVINSNSSNITLNDNVTFGGTTTLNSVTYTWPGADGSFNAALTTDGSGTLSWTNNNALGAWNHSDHYLYPDEYWADDIIIGGNSTASASIFLGSNGSTVFNEQGNDADFRVETSGQANAFFIDGATGYIGIGDGTPDHTLDIAGNIGLDASGYVNWGDVDGSAGYGFRDNGGVLQYKNTSGVWTDVGIAANTHWQLNNGSLSPISLTADVNLGSTASSSAKISLAGSLNRGRSAIIVNQTENQDIFTASASGNTRFTIANNGDLLLDNGEFISNTTDDLLVFGGSGGSNNTDLTIDLDGANPVLYSALGLGIEINDRLYIGTNNRYFYDEAGQLSLSSNFGVDSSLAVGNVNATGNTGELITGSNVIIDNLGDLRLRENSSNGTNYTGFQAPDNLVANIVYTLPDADGSVGTVLMTDGSGNLTWGSNSAGDYWQQVDGVLSPVSLTLGLNLGSTATSSAKVSIAGSLDRGQSALIVNQTENQDIFTASASGSTRFTIDNDGNLDVTGNIGLAAGNYINWGSVLGTSGYGFRDSGGTLQFKHDGGTWEDVGTGSSGGGGGDSLWSLSAGSISPAHIFGDVNFGDSATISAKVSIAGSFDRGLSALIVNQTEDQDILTASASGATRLQLTNSGDLDIYGSGSFGNLSSIDPYRTLNVGQNYTNVDQNSTYSEYLTQTRTESALTGDTTAYGIFNNLLYRMAENSYNGVGIGGENTVHTDGTYTYEQLVGARNVAYSLSTAGAGQDQLFGTQNLAYLNSTGTVDNAYGSSNQVYNTSTGTITNAIGTLGEAYTDNAGATITNATGVKGSILENGGLGTITTGKALEADCDDAATCYGLYINGNDAGSTTGAYGIFGENGDWVLDADGQGTAGDITYGGDLFFGEDQDAAIYYDGTDLSINPQVVGSGDLYLRDGAYKTAQGQFESTVADGGSTTAFEFNTTNSLVTDGALIADFQNAGTSLFTIDKDGNVWAKGNIYSDKGFGMSMKNVGPALSQYDLVAINTTEDNTDGVPRMSATSSAMAKVGFGVVQEACTTNATCKVVFQGESIINVSNETNRGDYLFSSTSLGKAAAHTKQYDGMLGIATSTDLAAPYQVEMIFLHQPSVDKLRVADKNRMHSDYREAAIDYTYANETNYYDIDENVRKGLYFDTFQDKVKIDSSNSDSIVDDVNQRAGLFGGITMNSTNTDSEGNTLLSENTTIDLDYFDRTNNQTRTEPDTLTQVLNGVDPNWYNGVSLVEASKSAITSRAPTNLSQTYNGGLIKTAGRYATGEDNGPILITIKSDNEATDSANPTLTIDWKTLDDPNSPAHSGSNVIVTKGTATTLETGTNDVTVTFSHTQYHPGDLFKIASWYLEPAETNDRGSRQTFPERAYIVATQEEFQIIDADTNKVWITFQEGSGNITASSASRDITSVQMFNGKLFVATTGTSGLFEINFAKDDAYRYYASSADAFLGIGLKDRNELIADAYDLNVSQPQYAIASGAVNDVHANIIGKTEIVAVATDDGLSVINKLIGKTIDLYDTATDDYNQVWLTNNNLLYATNETKGQLEIWSEVISQTSDNSEYKRILDQASAPEIFDTVPIISTNPDALVVTAKDSRETEEITVSGWGYVEGDGSGGATDYMYYGVNFDEIPVIHVTSNGNTNDFVPSTLAECNEAGSGGFDFGASALRDRAEIQLNADESTTNSVSNRYYCYSWTATGSISSVSQESEIFLGTNEGLIKVREHLTSSLAEGGSSPNQKSVKRYTKDYISEELIGDVNYSFPFNGSGAIANGTTSIAGADMNGNNLTATNTNGTGLQYVSGVRGTAIEFDGVDDVLCSDNSATGTCADNDLYDLTAAYASWSFWIKPDTITSGDGIMTKGGSAGYDIYFNSDNSLTLQINATDELVGTTPIQTGEWTHVAFTYNDTLDTAFMYINGSLVQTDTTATTPFANATDYLEFGYYPGGSYYDGLIDEPNLTSTLLTPFQIKNMYESGKRALDSSHQLNDFRNNLDSGSDSVGAYSNVSAVGIQHINGDTYAYVAMEDGDEDGDGWINKVDLSSDTVVQTFNTSSGVSIPSNDVTSLAVSTAGLELVGMNGTGAYVPAYNSNMSATTGTYYSDTIALPEDINNAYAWINEYVDSACASCSIKVYASNNGGSTWTPGTVTSTDTNQSPPEKEYLFSFTSAGGSLKFRVDFTRDSNKAANVYIKKYGIAWFNDDNVLGGSTGGIFTNNNESVAHGDYIELTHGQGTNDILADGWVYDSTDGKWKPVNQATSSAIATIDSLDIGTTDWTSSDNTNFSTTLNTSNKTEGTASLEISAAASSEGYNEWIERDFSSPIDISNKTIYADISSSITHNNLLKWHAWENSQSGTTSFSDNLTTDNATTGWTERQVINGSNISTSGNQFRVQAEAHSSSDTRYHQWSICERSSGSTCVAGTWKNITWEDNGGVGRNTGLIPAGTSRFSDWIDYDIDETKDYLITFYRAIGGMRYIATGGGGDYQINSDVTDTENPGGLSFVASRQIAINSIEVRNVPEKIISVSNVGTFQTVSWDTSASSSALLDNVDKMSFQYDANTAATINIDAITDQADANTLGDYYQIEQIDENTVRLWNFSGSTQNLRLDVSTGGVGQNSGSVSLAPLAADVDAKSGTNSIWINKTDESGNLLKLQNDAIDRFTIDYGGNATLSGSLKLNGQLQLGSFASDPTAMGEGSVYYNTTDDTVYFYNGSTWGALGAGSGGSSYWNLASGALTPLQTSYEINLGNAATDSAKISLAGSNDRGKAAVIINQTEDQDIWTASASGVTRLTLTNDGDLLPGTDDTQDIGSNSFRWQDLFLGPSTLHIGEDLTDEYTISYDTTSNSLGFNANGTGDAEVVFDSIGRVGIGDTTPEGKLDVDGAVTGKALVQLNQTGDQDILVASVSGSTRFRVDNNGYVHSQRFVDLANSAYYLDPAATGTSLNVAGDAVVGGGEVFFYDTNTYITGDGTNLSFKDSYLTAPIALSESGTTQLHAGFTMNSIVAALNELMNISLGDTTNIFLNSFRQQEQNDLLFQLFEDGVADEFEGLDGIDLAASAYTYDSTNDYFSRANPTSDITHDSESDFTTNTTTEKLEVTSAPVIQLAKKSVLGDGSDGNITINDTKSLTSDPIADERIFADGIAYKVNGISTNGVSTENAPHGIEVGDEVVLINLQGDATNYTNVGNYEFLTVSAISDVNTTFTSSVTKTYGIGGNSNIAGQDIVIQRVPNYANVTILSGGTLTADDFDSLETEPTTPASTAGRLTGIVMFRATGTVDVQSGGIIDMTGKGYRASLTQTTTSGEYGYPGESMSGDISRTYATTPVSGGGGGFNCTGGAGGGYGTAGVLGTRAGTACGGTRNTASPVNGDADLVQLRLGSAGGAGGQGHRSTWTYNGALGGDGGGVIYITANTITAASGSITANGVAGDNAVNPGGTDIAPGGGGGGAGGSIYLAGATVDVSGTVTASGAAGGTTQYSDYGGTYVNEGGYAHGGAGGDGRIKIDATSTTGSTTPTATEANLSLYENYGIFTSDELYTPNTVSFDQIQWSEVLNIYGEVQVMTRSGGTNNSTDGSWEEWRPVITNTNAETIDNLDVHTNWDSYTPIDIREQTETQWAAGVEKYQTVETNDLDGKLDIERRIDNGDASDGDITVSTSKNINTDVIRSGGTYADGVSYVVSSISSLSLVTSATPNGIVAGDEVILINIHGDDVNYNNVGNYEFLEVESVSGTTLNFESAISKTYGVGSNADLTGQQIIVQRVPQYNNVTIQSGGTITANTYDGTSGGLLFFRVAGTLDIQSGGTIDMTGKGYRASNTQTNTSGIYGYQGESTSGTNVTRNYVNFPDGGGGGGNSCTGGAGGGYGEDGVTGTRAGTACGGTVPPGGAAYGDANLSKIYMGSAGGAGGQGYRSTWTYNGALGGDGGGVIYITANTITAASGSITANGVAGDNAVNPGGTDIAPGGGGGGAGGSIYLAGATVDVSGTVTASGAAGGTTQYSDYGGTYVNEGGYAHGGAGGDGRIKIDANRLTGTTSPTYTLGTTNNVYQTYGYFTSDELPTTDAYVFDNISWVESLGNTGEIQVQTRSGNTSDSTDGSWEEWRPVVDGTNEISIADLDTHTDWTGTNVTVAEGDVARDEDYWEDDDSLSTEATKFSSSTQYGYAETDLGSGNEVNLANYDYLTFWVRSSTTSDALTMSIGENNGTEQEEDLYINATDTWQKVYWDITDVAAGNRDAIRYLRVTNNTIKNIDFYVDDIKGGRYISEYSGYQIPSTTNNYTQYRVIFTTTDNSAAPTLEEITLSYRTSGNDTILAEGDVTRDVAYYEDNDEATATNILKTTYNTKNGYIERDLGGGNEVDLSNYDYISFWIRSSDTGRKFIFSMGEANSTEQEENISITTANTWQKVYWDISDINAGNRDDIRHFRLTYTGESSTTVYLDNIAANKYLTNSSGAIITSSANEYIQYRLFLSTTNDTVTPTVNSVTINYTDQLGHNDSNSSDFDAGVEKFQSESSASGTVNISANKANAGNGKDGSITVSTTTNINTDTISSGRNYPDGAIYTVSALGTSVATTSAIPNGITHGDEVVLINLQGDNTNYDNVGTYEFLTVKSVNGTALTFTSAIQGTYGVGGNSDLTGQNIVIQRIPQYVNVTVASGGTITANDFDGSSGGILFFRATGTVKIESGGTISMEAKGYPASQTQTTTNGEYGYQGTSTGDDTPARDYQATTVAGGGGGFNCTGGAGGAYGTAGEAGTRAGTACSGTIPPATTPYGSEDLQKLYLGSAGGAGGQGYRSSWTYPGALGGDGGGIVYISANIIDVEDGISSDGTLSADGEAGDNAVNPGGSDIAPGGGGGGAGGSMYLIADTVTIPVNTTAAAGAGGTTQYSDYGSTYVNEGGYAHGGAGGDGRIKIDANTITGTTTPSYYSSGLGSAGYYPYAIFTSDEINTAGATSLDTLSWTSNIGASGMIQMMTRSGSTADSTDGTWEEWQPVVGGTNELTLENADTHSNWVGYSPQTVADDTQAEFDAISVEKFRTSSTTTPSLKLDHRVADGDGSDGSLSLSSSVNLNSDLIATGRTGQADGIAYRIDAATASGTVVGVMETPNGIVAGDEVLLINMQGEPTDYADVGNYEYLIVDSVSGNEVTFKSTIQNSYDGTTPSNQKVIMQRVPQYTDVTLENGGIITTGKWDALATTPSGTAGYQTGIIAFRASGKVWVKTGAGIDASELGFFASNTQTTTYGQYGFQGTSIGDDTPARDYQNAVIGGGGGGISCTGGAGGGYGSAGVAGTRAGTACGGTPPPGGASYGDANLDQIFLGSAGGAGGQGYRSSWTYPGALGGDGGGVILIHAQEVEVDTHPVSTNGYISAAGQPGDNAVNPGGTDIAPGGGGGGAGGSIYISADRVTTDDATTIYAEGGSGGVTQYSDYGSTYVNEGGYAHGGAGGDGRIRLNFNRFDGTTSPSSYTAGITSNELYPYGIYTSDEMSTNGTVDFKTIEWIEKIADTNDNDVQVLTRTGNTADSTTGTWEEWKPATGGVNELTIDTMDTHTDWTGTNITVAEGDVTRDKNYYEDEDEITATNITKLSTSTQNGYTSMDLGGGNEVDLSSYNYISFWVRGSKDNANFKIGMGEAAATEQEENIIIEDKDEWQKVYWDISDISTSARDSVRYFRITYLDDSTDTVDLYVDNIVGNDFYTTPTGSPIESSANNYIQYRLIFTATDTTGTNSPPEVYRVAVNYVTNSAIFYSQEGNVTRDTDYYEDEDESTATAITRLVSSSTETDKNFVESTISSTNLTNYDYISFWVRSSKGSTEIPMRIGMGETEGDEQYMDFIVETPNTWQKVYWDITDISATDKDAITKLRITNFGPYINDVYIDDFNANTYLDTSGDSIPSTANTYFQYRAILTTTDTSTFPILDQVSLAYSGESNIVSKDFVANTLPRRANLISWADLGTGSIDYWASRDGGTTWTEVTMTEQATESGTTKIYSGFADITSQPEGTDMRWKARITGNAVLKSMAMRWEEGGGADLAEWYPTTDPTIKAAEVISADTTSSRSGYIKRTTKAYDPAVLGVISTAPGLQIGEYAENTKRVALAGRVPVLVASTSAAIKTGDFITSSDVPGRAMKAIKTGYTIGKALENWDPNSGKDSVMVFMNLGTHINENDIGGIDTASLEDIFGENSGEVLGASESATATDSADTTTDPTATNSADVTEASESATATNSGVLNPTTATNSATLVQESLTARLKKIANERLDALFTFTGQEQATDSAHLTDTLNIVTNDSIEKAQVSLYEARDKFKNYGDIVGKTVGASTINAYHGLNAASATIYGRLVASSADIYGKLTAVSGEFLDLFSQRVVTNELDTNLISPIDPDGTIRFRLGANSDATDSGKLVIEDASGSAVTTIDSQGNITTLGDLIASEVITSSISADVATFVDATISGQLDATSSRLEKLESKLAQIEKLDAQTANIVNATISGTLFADNINDFSNKVAQAIEEPSLLEKLMGTNTNTVESIDSYFANHDTFVTDLDTSSTSRLALTDLELTEDDLVIDATALYVEQYFDVNGSAFVAENLGIGQSLVIADSMYITAGSIDYAPIGIEKPTLNIQPSGKGMLSLMAGLFTLDESGTARVNGDLSIAGDLRVEQTLLTNMIAANDFTNPFQVQLATISGQVLGDSSDPEVQESRFEILNELGVPVATISAQGKAQFSSGLGIGSEALEATDSAQIESEKTSGTATIKANSSEIVIKSPVVSEASLIYVTPLGSTGNKVLYVKEITNDNPETPELESYFKVGFDTSVTTDVRFNWWIVN